MMRTPSLMTVDARDMALVPQRGAVPGRRGVCRRRLRVSAKQRTTVEGRRGRRAVGLASRRRREGLRVPRGASARDRANLVVAALALLELDQPLALRVGEQLGEASVAVIALGEIRIDALQGLLH